MSLLDLLHHRRAIRKFKADAPLSTELVRSCIEQAQLAPTSSNMQLWEAYHVTSPQLLKALSAACLGQNTARTAQQMVVFVTRQDLHRQHAAAVLEFELENARRNVPAEKLEKRHADLRKYYQKLMPFVYSRACGLLGAFRSVLAYLTSLIRPSMTMLSDADLRVVVHKSCALAIQTFMLAMAEQQYDTCPVEGYDARRIKRLLDLPSGAEVCMVITCGVREAGGVNGDRFRLPFSEIYHQR